MSWFSSKDLILFIIFLLMCSASYTSEAVRGNYGGNGANPKPKPTPPPKQSPTSSPSPRKATFNVLDFGAEGNGVADDTKAFLSAWAAACEVEASIVVVPSGSKFLVGPISFAGPNCQQNIVFQLDGTIVAPTGPKVWGKGLLQWLEFAKLTGITIQGSGIIDGQGSVWWSSSQLNNYTVINTEVDQMMPLTKPTALRFYGSYNVNVTGITIQNSPQCHLKFDSCEAVQISNITISSPGDSPNTDGIHLQNSIYVSIHHSNLGCGDDCVSIQTGCSNIHVHDLNCGPGHGISIGGLGKDETKACVSNITVENVDLQNTMTGVRIKTWQGGMGSVSNIKYSNIQLSEVQMPIVIDQYYCDGKGSCKNQTSAVALSGITYENIRGTYTVKPVYLACSDSLPCSGISLTDIELEALGEGYNMYGPFCWQAYGKFHSPMIPPIDCLQNGMPTIYNVQANLGSC